MARSSPGASRVVAVLNFFAAHPGQSFTLTELIRALCQSRATCHELLNGLVEAGYLYRTIDKSYVLGPTLGQIGRIANENASPLQIAQPEIRLLADEFDAICSAYFVEGDEVVARARAIAVSQLGWPLAQGVRMKLRAPFAAAYFAWRTPSEVNSWLDAQMPKTTLEQRDSMEKGMIFARKHLFFFGVRNTSVPKSEEATKKAFSDEFAKFPVSLAPSIETTETYNLAYVTAPVFGVNQQIMFSLSLVGFDTLVKGSEVMRMGTHLREACGRISEFIVGKKSPVPSSSDDHFPQTKPRRDASPKRRKIN